MRFVVFLDIDGVLNTRTTVKRTPYGYTGIDDARVKVLANAIEKCGPVEFTPACPQAQLVLPDTSCI